MCLSVYVYVCMYASVVRYGEPRPEAVKVLLIELSLIDWFLMDRFL